MVTVWKARTSPRAERGEQASGAGAVAGRPLDRLLTPTDVAELLRCSARQVLRLPIRRLRLGARRGWRFREADVAGWIADELERAT